MQFLGDTDRAQIMKWFANEMTGDIKIVHFTHVDRLSAPSLVVPAQRFEYFRETVGLLTEVADFSEKIQIEVYDLEADVELAEQYGIDKAPGTALVAGEGFGIRFYGVPSGQAFSALIQTIIDISNGNSRLGEELHEELRKVDRSVHLQVFITPI